MLLSLKMVGLRFQAAARAAGVERVTAHSGRVGLASELTSRGASATDVMLAGNWTTSRMVAALLGRGDRPSAGPWRGTSEHSPPPPPSRRLRSSETRRCLGGRASAGPAHEDEASGVGSAAFCGAKSVGQHREAGCAAHESARASSAPSNRTSIRPRSARRSGHSPELGRALMARGTLAS